MTIDYTRPQPPPPPQHPATPPPRRSWWSRNWGWVVAAGCLVPVLLMGSCVAAVAWFTVGAIRSSEPYQEALDRARAHPAVAERLGTPIEPKWWLTGSIDLNNDTGTANIRIPISGPKGEASIDVAATKSSGAWTYTRMLVEPATGPPIDLLHASLPSTEEPADTDPAGG